MEFPEKSNYFFLLSNISESFGGLTNSMLRRARLFFEYANVKTEILTFNYNTDYDQIREMLDKKGLIPKEIRVTNMYESLSGDHVYPQEPSRIQSQTDEKYIVEPVVGRNCFRYYENGMYRMYKSFERPDGKLKFIDYFNENHYKIKREEFDAFGTKRKEIHMDYLNTPSLPRQELYFNQSGRCYLNIWYKTVNEKSEIDRIHLFINNQIKIFRAIDELRSFWLESYLNHTRQNFLIVDGRALDPVVLSLTGDHTYKIFMTHSTHLRPPFHVDSVIRLGNRPVLNKLNHVDALVLLTQYQKNDIVERFGPRNNYFVIPHSVENNLSNDQLDHYERKEYTGVMMARYHEEKQLDHAIRAYSKVVKVFPQAKLELYGFGEEEQSLSQLINELHLNNNVFLKGFTNQAGVIFEESTFSMLTSKYEGFGLSLVESLVHGCPIICYDIKYGPSDMIVDGKNGYLVEPNNIDSLAEKIIELLSNQDCLGEFSRNARIKAQEFSNEKFIKNWSELFFDILDNRTNRFDIDNFDFYMEFSDWSSNEEYRYDVQGNITLDAEMDTSSIDDLKAKVIVRERERKELIEIDTPLIRGEGLISFSFLFNDLVENAFLSVGIWDVNLLLHGNNYYQEKRIGYKKSQSATQNKRVLDDQNLGVSIEPYYTNPYGNLSFKITKLNVEESLE